GVLLYYGTAVVVLLGMVLGHEYLKSPRAHDVDLLRTFGNWDGKWYREIVDGGYSYDRDKPSNVAFFPGYPILGRALVLLSEGDANLALLLVSHVCLAAAFGGIVAYAAFRCAQNAPERGQQEPATWALLAIAFWPTTFFFRMAYSESLFLLCTVLALYAMERRWPLVLIAAIVGFATATRAVGVALLLPLAICVWRQSGPATGPLPKERVLRFVRNLWLFPVACWGLLAYMLYLWLEFGEPLAFAKTQENWRMRPAVPLYEKLVDLVTLEPVWSIFDPSSP